MQMDLQKEAKSIAIEYQLMMDESTHLFFVTAMKKTEIK
jgi:hypothetical protein